MLTAHEIDALNRRIAQNRANADNALPAYREILDRQRAEMIKQLALGRLNAAIDEVNRQEEPHQPSLF